MTSTKNRVTKTAVNSENTVPQKSVYAKPFTVPVPSMNSTPAPTIVVTWLSNTDVNARLKPILTAERNDLPAHSSSLRRSKISTLASTAIPIESTKPAMPGSVSTACAADSSAEQRQHVDDQRDVGEQPRQPVHHRHEDQHEAQADHRGVERLLQVFGTEDRADVILFDDRRRHRQRAGVQLVGQQRDLVFGERAGDLTRVRDDPLNRRILDELLVEERAELLAEIVLR